MTLAKGIGHVPLPLGSRGPGASDGPVAPRPADEGNGGGGEGREVGQPCGPTPLLQMARIGRIVRSRTSVVTDESRDVWG